MSTLTTPRRKFIATVGGMALTGMAGCSSVTQQSFEATPVILPESARKELVLAETARESETTTRDGPSGNVEVTITSHSAVYRRGPARGTPTVIEQFASGVNETPGSVINVLASEVRADVWPKEYIKDGVQVSGDQFSLVVPEGARGTDSAPLAQTMALVPGPALGNDTVTYDGDEPGGFFASEVFFPPNSVYRSGNDYFASDMFFPSKIYSPDSLDEFRVFVPNSRAFVDRRGPIRMPDEAQPVESGETIHTANTVFVTAGDVISPRGPDAGEFDTTQAFNAGVHLPLGGTPFGLGVLSTPNASVAGQSANPLVGEETTALIQRDAAKQVLAQTGLTDADTVEWRAGPTPVAEVVGNSGYLSELPDTTASLVGTDTDVESFIGVVSGEDGPWGVFLNVARVTDDDHMIAVSGLTRPVGTVEGGMTAVEGSGWGMDQSATLLTRTHEFTGTVFEALKRT